MRAKKHFGQNFLVDETVIERIVACINPQPGQHIIEIGPGRGALSLPLAASGARLDLIELDRDLMPALNAAFATQDNVRVVQQDALTLTLEASDLRVVGNLPYNVSTPLLIHLLKQHDHIHDMLFMLQKEVTQRVCAAPGSRDFGRLSVMLQHRFECHALLEIPPTAFTPRPAVDSQLLSLRRRSDVPDVALDALERLVRQAFSQRRKTLRNNLKKHIDDATFAALNIDASQRPEQLSVADYERLSRHVD